MPPAPEPRHYELVARLLRDVDRESVIHRLLSSCLNDPCEFAGLLPHLPADLQDARDRAMPAAAHGQVECAAKALELAALATRHARSPGPADCAPACSCRAVQAEGIDRYLARAAGPASTVLRASSEPYYQHLGELVQWRAAGPGRSERDCAVSAHTASG